MNASKVNGFSISINRTLKTHEINTAHKLWSKLCTTGNAAFLANCGQGVGATWAETAPQQGTPDDEWKTAKRRLRLWIGEPRSCECGMLKDETGAHTLACQQCHGELKCIQSARQPCETNSHDGSHGRLGKSRTVTVRSI